MIRTLLLACFLLGCGSGMNIERHHVPQEALDLINPIKGRPGFAIWDFDLNTCDIFILPRSTFGVLENDYHEVLGEETRHCFEGHYHPKGE